MKWVRRKGMVEQNQCNVELLISHPVAPEWGKRERDKLFMTLAAVEYVHRIIVIALYAWACARFKPRTRSCKVSSPYLEIHVAATNLVVICNGVDSSVRFHDNPSLYLNGWYFFLFPEPSHVVDVAVSDGVSLPCDVSSKFGAEDFIKLVLWFKDNSTAPIYSWAF